MGLAVLVEGVRLLCVGYVRGCDCIVRCAYWAVLHVGICVRGLCCLSVGWGCCLCFAVYLFWLLAFAELLLFVGFVFVSWLGISTLL